jgi:hypothetical protein
MDHTPESSAGGRAAGPKVLAVFQPREVLLAPRVMLFLLMFAGLLLSGIVVCAVADEITG